MQSIEKVRYLTWMFLLKLRQVVHILIDNDVQAIRLAMLRHVRRAERLRHDDDYTLLITGLQEKNHKTSKLERKKE